jgi:hypothetical protein
MIARAKGRWGVFAVAGVVCASVALAAQNPGGQKPSRSHNADASESDQRASDMASVSHAVIAASKFDEKAQAADGNASDKSPEQPQADPIKWTDKAMAAAAVAQAIFAFALVILTWRLWGVGRNQAKIADDALAIAKAGADAANLSTRVALEAGELAKSQFVAAYRPRITIRGLFVLNAADSVEDSALLFQLYNKGDGEAEIVDIKFYMNISGASESILPHLTLFEPKLPIKIQSGYDERARAIIDASWKGWFRDEYSVDAEHSIKFELWKIELRVTVVYLDQMGRRRQTSVHRSYDAEARKFSVVKDSEFEYED